MKRLHKQYHYYGQSFTTIAALLVVAVIGAYLLISTHAATPYGSVETETGTLTTGAAVQPETNASNGSDVQFGQTTNTNPGLGTFLACPSGAVQVSTGSIPSFQPNTNYCFAKGTYSHFSTTPQTGDGFYGQGNAVLDGGSSTSQAFNSAETHIISGVTIDGFTMQNYSDPGGQPYAVVEVNGGSNVTLSNNTFNDDNTTAISFGGHDGNVPCCGPEYDYSVQNSLVTHNVIENIGYSGINISGSWGGTTVSYNAVSNTDTERIDPEIDVAAIGKFANNDGLIVKGNTTSNNYDIGMRFRLMQRFPITPFLLMGLIGMKEVLLPAYRVLPSVFRLPAQSPRTSHPAIPIRLTDQMVLVYLAIPSLITWKECTSIMGTAQVNRRITSQLLAIQ
jgi:hypothetical protein